MFEVIDAGTQASYDAVFLALKALDPQSEFVLVRKQPEASGAFAWVQAWHHDLDGAIRSFRYMATKVRASYDPADPKGRKVMSSIDRHLEVVQKLKTEIFDQLFKLT